MEQNNNNQAVRIAEVRTRIDSARATLQLSCNIQNEAGSLDRTQRFLAKNAMNELLQLGYSRNAIKLDTGWDGL